MKVLLFLIYKDRVYLVKHSKLNTFSFISAIIFIPVDMDAVPEKKEVKSKTDLDEHFDVLPEANDESGEGNGNPDIGT